MSKNNFQKPTVQNPNPNPIFEHDSAPNICTWGILDTIPHEILVFVTPPDSGHGTPMHVVNSTYPRMYLVHNSIKINFKKVL